MPLNTIENITPRGQSYPTIDRYTVATLPNPKRSAVGKWAIVTDGKATPSQAGIAPVGSGSLENVVWNNGRAWIVV